MTASSQKKRLSELSPQEFLEHLERTEGTDPRFLERWYHDEAAFFKKLSESEGRQITPADVPSSRTNIEHYVKVALQLTGADAQALQDVAVGCISRMDIDAAAIKVPSGGHVVIVSFGFLTVMMGMNAVHNRLLHERDCRIDPIRRHAIYRLLNTIGEETDPRDLPNLRTHLDTFSADELRGASRQAIDQLLFVLLHEFGHIRNGDLQHKTMTQISALFSHDRAPESMPESYDAEFEADAFAIRCLASEVTSEKGRAMCAITIGRLLDGFRLTAVAKGHRRFHSASHPEPTERLAAALDTLYQDRSEVAREGVPIETMLLVWGTAAAQFSTRWGIHDLIPTSLPGRLLLLMYSLAAWASDASSEYQYRLDLDAVRSANRDSDDDVDVSPLERKCETIEARRDWWSSMFHQLVAELGIETDPLPVPSTFDDYDLEVLRDYRDPVFWTTIREFMRDKSKALSEELTRRFCSGGRAWAPNLGVYLGQARVECQTWTLVAEHGRSLEPEILKSAVKDLQRLIRAGHEEAEKFRKMERSLSGIIGSAERAVVRRRTGFAAEREAITKSLKMALGCWVHERGTDEKASRDIDLLYLIQRLLGELVTSKRIEGLDFIRLGEVIDDLAMIFANDPLLSIHPRRDGFDGKIAP